LHQVEGKALEKVEAKTLGWQILHTGGAPGKRNSAQFGSTKEKKLFCTHGKHLGEKWELGNNEEIQKGTNVTGPKLHQNQRRQRNRSP